MWGTPQGSRSTVTGRDRPGTEIVPEVSARTALARAARSGASPSVGRTRRERARKRRARLMNTGSYPHPRPPGRLPDVSGLCRTVLRVLLGVDRPQQLRRALPDLQGLRAAPGQDDDAPLPRVFGDPVEDGGDLFRLKVDVPVVEGGCDDPGHVRRVSEVRCRPCCLSTERPRRPSSLPSLCWRAAAAGGRPRRKIPRLLP